MNFGANKTPVYIIREGAFGVTYFRDIYSSGTKRYGKNSVSWKILSEVLLSRLLWCQCQ